MIATEHCMIAFDFDGTLISHAVSREGNRRFF
jgi:hypothetical protein